MRITVNDVDFEFAEISAGHGCDAFWLATTHTTEAQWRAVMGGEFVNGARFPKGNVSLNDAREFCAKLGELSGARFRLPTEFEYCAALGKEPTDLENYAVFDVGAPVEVGTKRPNEFGLFGMRGWLWHILDAGKKQNGKPRKYCILRGGAWGDLQDNSRAVHRYLIHPANRLNLVGFRVVLCRPLSSL